MGGCPIAFIHKTRDPRIPNESITGRVVGDVVGQTCVVIDDMIDTAGTITKAVDALFDAGAADVIIAATHAVFSGPAVDRLKNSRASEVVITNTLPITEDQKFDNLTVLSIAPLLGRAIREVFEDGSVTSLFDGHSLARIWCFLANHLDSNHSGEGFKRNRYRRQGIQLLSDSCITEMTGVFSWQK